MTTTENIKKSIDLADYVRSCGITLTKHGKNDFKGLCPFHDDHNPSLIISSVKQLFNCPACGTGGSIIDFVMLYHKTDLKGAIKILSKLLSSQTPKTAAENPPPEALRPERAAELLERAISFYEKTFANTGSSDLKSLSALDGRKYLESRGITDAGLFTKHRIGYADGSLLNALPKKGKIIDDLKKLGVLLDTSGGDLKERFKGCVVFPVFDTEGNITTLYGRSISGRKHIYLPDRPTGLFNIAVTRTYPEIVLVESCIDALSCEMAGINNVVSIQSTNGLNDEHISLFAGNEVTKVTLLLDGDEAGQNASFELLKRLSESFKVTKIPLPDDMDPNSYLVKHGPESLQNLFSFFSRDEARRAKTEDAPATPENNACGGSPQEKNISVNSCSFVAEKDKNTFVFGLRKYEIIGLEKKPRSLKATVRVIKSGKLHVDTIDFYSSRQRRQLSQEICNAFEELPETVNSDIAKLLKICEEGSSLHGKSAKFADGAPEEEKVTLSPAEIRDAKEFGRSEKLIENILSDYEKCGLVGEESNKLLCYLAMTSRKMPEPLSVLILSSSGAGKTALQDAALAFCPPEDLVKLTSLSAKALFYKEQTSLKHKVLAIEEGAGAEDAAYAIRNLISSDGLTSEVAIRDPQTGKLTTMANTVDGPVAVFCTTTDPEVDPETKSRFLVTGIDESREQTRRILEFQKERHSVSGLQTNLEKEKTLRIHRNFQRLLKSLPVVNPHIDKLSYSDDRLQGRRAQPQYLNIINAVAFLRQMSKECKHTSTKEKKIEYVEVDETDIEIGHKLAVEILGKTLDELSIPARDLLDLIDKMLEKKICELRTSAGAGHAGGPAALFKRDLTFTRRELRDFSGWTNYRVHTHIKELVHLEYVLLESGRSNSLQTYKLVYNGEGKCGGKFIPGIKNA